MSNKRTQDPLRENPIFLDLSSLLCNGYILSLFTIDFLYFEYVLPLLGASIMFYGCHFLHSQNTYFRKAYLISLVRLGLMLTNFLFDWTSIYDNLAVVYLQLISSVCLVTTLFYYLNLGYRRLYTQANISNYKNFLLYYIPFYWGTIGSTFLTHKAGILGAFLSIPILLGNIFYIVFSFHVIGKKLAHSNLDIELEHFSPHTKHKITLFLSAYCLLLVITIFLSNKGAFFETTSTVIDTQIATTTSEIRDKLERLGMEDAIIHDLSLDSTEFNEYQSAQTIYQNRDTYKINGGALELTIYNVKRSSDSRMLIYYQWINEPINRLYHIVECQSEDFTELTNINSKCLYDNQDSSSTYQIPYVNTGLNDAHFPYANHKIPNEGSNLRGYLAFTYVPGTHVSESNPFHMVLNYYYQVSIFNLPYLNIMDYMDHYSLHSSSYVYNRLTIPFRQTH